MEAMKGVEPLSFGLQDRRSVIQLSYIAMVAQTSVCDCSNKRWDLQWKAQTEVCATFLVDWEGFKPSQEVCRTSMLSLHHQPKLKFQVSSSKFQVRLLVT